MRSLPPELKQGFTDFVSVFLEKNEILEIRGIVFSRDEEAVYNCDREKIIYTYISVEFIPHLDHFDANLKFTRINTQ